MQICGWAIKRNGYEQQGKGEEESFTAIQIIMSDKQTTG